MVISSIDLMDGKSVQLKQGSEKILERDNPVELAIEFNKYGETAVIDLDAAFGKGNNIEVIRYILKHGECRVGGGISTIKKAKELISYGAKKVIIGSIAFKDDKINDEFLAELCNTIGKYRIIIAIDSLNNEIVTKGWKHKTGLNLFEVIPRLDKYCSEYLYTYVDKEGTLEGISLEAVNKIKSITKNKVTAAGGVKSIDEVRYISSIGFDAQLGMSIYTGKIHLAEAFIESLNWKNDLIPVITQNYSGDVLMQAYTNKDALKKTFETNKMWYFSRSRNQLWMKGETSGNTQRLIKLRADCDRDCILATVEQKGVACHTESYSCFGDRKFNLYELYEVLKSRIDNPAPDSYTAKLNDQLLAEKLNEEVQEVLEAVEHDHVVWEAADVIYFLTVLMAKRGVTFDEVFKELDRRNKK